MNRAPAHLLRGLAVLVFVGLATTSPTAPAASPTTAAVYPTDSQFLLFAFESLLNDGWRDAVVEVSVEGGKGCQETVRVVRKGEEVEGKKVVTGVRIRAFVGQRDRLVHDLVDHAKTINLGDKARNKELVEQLELYMKSVREHGKKLADELDVCAEEPNKMGIEILRTVDREVGPQRFAAALRTQETAYVMSQSTDDPLMAVFATALVAMAEDARIKRDVLTKARIRFNTYLADKSEKECPNGEGGRALYFSKSEKTASAASAELDKALIPQIEAAKALAQELATMNKWPDSETPFADKADRKIDLLTQCRLIDAEPVEKSKGENAEAVNRLDRAKRYARLARLVPASKNKANNYYRATFYYLAGLEANRAALLTVGTDGFSAAKVCPAAKASMTYWIDYKSNNDRDMTGDVLHNYCLALAYNHQAIAAFDALKVDSKFFPGEPEFFYDQARMCAVAAEDYAAALAKDPRKVDYFEQGRRHQRLRLMYQESSMSFDRAVFFGFKDFGRAKNVRDLKALREAEQSVVMPRRTFEAIVGDS
jgi:hypothetical protein